MDRRQFFRDDKKARVASRSTKLISVRGFWKSWVSCTSKPKLFALLDYIRMSRHSGWILVRQTIFGGPVTPPSCVFFPNDGCKALSLPENVYADVGNSCECCDFNSSPLFSVCISSNTGQLASCILYDHLLCQYIGFFMSTQMLT